MINHIQIWASKNFHISRKKQVSEFRNHSLSLLQNSGTIITNFLSSMANSLSSAVLVPILTFFFLLYRDFFRKFFYRVFGIKNRKRIDLVCLKIYKVVQGYLVGLMSVILIVAVLNTIGLVALGIDYAIFFGTLAAFLLLIPYIGITLGFSLAILAALLQYGPGGAIIGVLVLFGLGQFIEGFFLTPRLVGERIGLHPVAVLFALLLFGKLFGFFGVLLALPTSAVGLVLLQYGWSRYTQSSWYQK
jgi:predicted PurR-regulated permease PerM